MERELVVVLLAVIVTIWMAVAWSAHAGRGGRTSPASQAVGGLICGLLAAVVVAVPYVDVVPDEDETTVAVLLASILTLGMGIALVRWWKQRSPTEQAVQPRITSPQDQAATQRAVVARRSGREPQ